MKIRISQNILFWVGAVLLASAFLLTKSLPQFDIMFFVNQYIYVRNWIGLGLPFFFFGMAIRTKQEKLCRLPNALLLAIALAGIILSTIERISSFKLELYFGSCLTAIALCVFAIKHSESTVVKRPEILSLSSLLLYVIHPMVIDFFRTYCPSLGIGSTIAAWLMPFVVSAVSFGISIGVSIFVYQQKRCRENS